MKTRTILAALGVGGLPPAAMGQYAVTWSAFTCGGSTTPLAGGAFGLQCTIGAPAAGAASGGAFGVGGGFLNGGGAGGCYPNCDNSTTLPILNVADFTCFLQRFAAGDGYANCDASTTAPVLNVADFTCFLQRFAAGCP